MSYGSDYSEYDIFRCRLYSNGHCKTCLIPNQYIVGECVYCGGSLISTDTQNIHIAASIYHNWQFTKCRGWKWNNAHRRGTDVFQLLNVRVHHRSIYPQVSMNFGLFLSENERKLARVIKAIWSQRVREKTIQKLKKRRWAMEWVWRGTSMNYKYEQWRTEIPRTKWMTYAIEEGLTYRHIREYGYVPYVQEANRLQDELREIEFKTNSRIQRELMQ